MNGFSTEHWKSEVESMNQDTNNDVTDVTGAKKILGITRATLISWEKEGLIKSFKSAFNGRMRKCFSISELKKLAGQGNEVGL